MKIKYKKNRYPDLLTLLTLSCLVLMIFSRMNCKKDLENQSLLTGDCKFNEILVTINTNPITIVAGGSADIEMHIGVQSNCDGYAKSLRIYDVDDPEQTLCFNDALTNNSGVCVITISIPPNSPPATIKNQYNISVSSSKDFNQGTIISTSETLDVNIISEVDFSIISPPAFGVHQGFSFSIPIEIIRAGNHDENIELSINNLPNTVSYSFDPNPVPGNVNSSQLTITADYDAVPGEYNTRLIRGYDESNRERHDIFDLSIGEPFTISLEHEGITIEQGKSGTVDVYAYRTGIYLEDVFFNSRRRNYRTRTCLG